MPGLWVANATGTFVPAQALYVADAGGTWRLANDVLVADAAGTWRTSGLGAPAVSAPTITAGSPAWLKANVSWTAENATSYELQNEDGSVILTTAATSAIIDVNPNTVYRLKVKAIKGALNSTGPVAQYASSQVPAPSNLRTTGPIAHNDFDLLWDAVSGATGYRVRNAGNGNTAYVAAPSTTYDVDPSPSTAYDYHVRTEIGAYSSGYSATIRVVTPREPGPASGEYTYKATAGQTYQTGSGGIWRATSDGFYHGDGSAYGSTRGKQTGFFFYGANRFDGLIGGNATKFEIYMSRRDEAGASAAQSNHFYLHPYTSKPSGDPLNDFINSGDYGSLARGEAKWITLPTSWAQKLIDSTSGADGIAWGNVSGRYMNMNTLSGNDDIGKLRITIG